MLKWKVKSDEHYSKTFRIKFVSEKIQGGKLCLLQLN